MENFKIIWIYLEIVNLASFAMMGIDKRRAKKGRWRIPEATLILMAVIGGGIGSLGGMYLFRHKTRKPKFYIGIPVILVIQAALAFCLIRVISL